MNDVKSLSPVNGDVNIISCLPRNIDGKESTTKLRLTSERSYENCVNAKV